MQIAFKFHYIHDNGLFQRLCLRIKELSALEVTLYQDEKLFYIVASGVQEELEGLAELISSTMPQSLFLHESSVEEVGALDLDAMNKSTSAYYEIPYCIECQHEVIETLNPFTECKVCGFSEVKVQSEEFGCLDFNVLADSLIENKELVLETYNGIRRFALLDTQEKEESSLLVCNPSNISEHFLLTQGELDALMMIEKPSVRLKPKLRFYHENELQKPFYPVFFADDKVTLALTASLSEKGIFTVYCDKPPKLQVATALGEHIIVNTGRDILPFKSDFLTQGALTCSFDNYHAYADKDGLILDRDNIVKNTNSVEFVSKEEKAKSNNAVVFETAHAAFQSVVLEHNLDGKSFASIYLSKEHTSSIFSFSPKVGYTAMVKFADEILTHPKMMMESIASMDEGGKKLVENFQDKYSKLYESLLQTKMSEDSNTSMITKLWALAAHFIGLTNNPSYQTSSEHLESTALEFQGKSGPRIDYKVIKTDDGYYLDPRLAIRSCISFKLAGVDEYLLSFGFIDSLADFMAEQAEFCDGNIEIDGVVLTGSLFENHQLLMRTYNAITPNYKVYRNKRLSIDGANVAAGAVTLGSE